jgi:hypothetical protein
VALSGKTISLLSKPFTGGDGPSHTAVEMVFSEASADAFLPEEGNKAQRVMGGLKKLAAKAEDPFEPQAKSQLQAVVSGLATLLMTRDEVDVDELDAALSKDGFSTYQGKPIEKDEPVDRLAVFLTTLFGDSPEFKVARNHYEQATRAYGRSDWEAANAQFRSACDAAFDALAHGKDCPKNKKGGEARKWLETQGHLAKDEADLTKAFMAFAGRAGSHAGISDQVDAQLRRHFATALMSFAIAKLG